MCLLFESIKIYGRKFYLMDYHQQRMDLSVKNVFGTENQIQLSEVLVVPRFIDEAPWKCRLVYGQELRNTEFEPYQKKNIESLKLVEADHLTYAYKYYDRGQINQLFHNKGECDDILIVRNGLVTDASYANICFWDGSHWLTPAKPLLKGVKRQYYLDQNMIREAIIYADQVEKFPKACLINAMMDIGDLNVKSFVS